MAILLALGENRWITYVCRAPWWYFESHLGSKKKLHCIRNSIVSYPNISREQCTWNAVLPLLNVHVLTWCSCPHWLLERLSQWSWVRQWTHCPPRWLSSLHGDCPHGSHAPPLPWAHTRTAHCLSPPPHEAASKAKVTVQDVLQSWWKQHSQQRNRYVMEDLVSSKWNRNFRFILETSIILQTDKNQTNSYKYTGTPI